MVFRLALSAIQFAGVIGTYASPVFILIFLYSEELFISPILILTGFFLVAPGPVMLAIVQQGLSNFQVGRFRTGLVREGTKTL